MIILHVTYQAKDKTAAAQFYAELDRLNVLAQTREEPGCVHYEMFSPKEDASKVFLLEIWADAAAQQEHKTTPAFFALQEQKAKYILSTDVKQYSSLS